MLKSEQLRGSFVHTVLRFTNSSLSPAVWSSLQTRLGTFHTLTLQSHTPLGGCNYARAELGGGSVGGAGLEDFSGLNHHT